MYVQITAHDIMLDGRPVRLSFTNDVTEKLKAEESLRKSEANLQTIMRTTDTAYGLFNTNMEVVTYNQMAGKFVEEQYHHMPQKGDSLFSAFLPADKLARLKDFASEVLSGNSLHYEINYPQDDGSARWFFVRWFPILSDSKEILGMMVALDDITERKNAEEDLKNAYGRIQEHINSIKAMAWKQSHVMRSPLANLKALAGILKDDPADPFTLEHFMYELNRLDAIIHEMAQDASDNVMDSPIQDASV
jgi:PAS domain S-box-containing protein